MGFAAIVTLFSSVDLDFYAETVPKLLKVASVFIGMQLFDNLLVQPYIFSKSVKAHPIEIFLVIVIGSKLGGILGMVVAIPFYTAIRVIASIFLSEFKVVQYFAEQLEIRKYNLLDAQYKNTDPGKRYLSNDKLADKSGWKQGKKE
jgi:predicted PurR-regulated permease PerM